tara:strand:- start:987 stop:2123 length:1137 start_codon:yes stop_codon:yes gene_type:complete
MEFLARFLLFAIAVIIFLENSLWAFDFEFNGRLRGDERYILDPPEGIDNIDSAIELRLGGHGDFFKAESWDLDYEILVDTRAFDGPSEKAGFSEDFDLDIFRGWVRLDYEKWRLRAGRQQILFGAGNLFRPLGFFDDRIISSVFPLTAGVDGFRFSWFQDEVTTFQAWAVPSKIKGRLIIGGRWESILRGIETGIVIQHSPKTELRSIPNFDLETFQVGYHMKGEYELGLWSEGRFDLEKKIDGNKNRFESVVGADYTFDLGEGLHFVLEYFMSISEKNFSIKDLKGDHEIYQFGVQLDQPVGIATVWRAFGFYDIRDGSFQIAPQIEYAVMDNTFFYLRANWGGDTDGKDFFGRLSRKSFAFSGMESSVGATLIIFF